MKLYKATRPDGTDFKTGTVDYGAALGTKVPVMHPSSTKIEKNVASTYLSVSTQPTGTMIGGKWPCRLFRVRPVGRTMGKLYAHPHKRAALGVVVVEELPSWMVFGPNGEAVAQVIEAAGQLTPKQVRSVSAAWDAAWDAAWSAARSAARDAAWDAARSAARDAAWDAAWSAARDAISAELVRDLITPEQHHALMAPWGARNG